MSQRNETNIMRALGMSALALAFLVTIMITIDSGILGGDDPFPDAVTTVVETTPEEPAAGGAAPPAAEPAPEAPAADEATAPITLETQTYVIEGGDSFFSIATRFNTSIDELQRLNPSVNPQNLSPGTELVVPKASEGEG